MKKLKHIIPVLISLLFIVNVSFAQWQTDRVYGFKINLPSSWSKSSYMDGTDKVYDYYSPDENAAIQLRVFHAAGVTTDVLVQVYEENMLPAGSQKESLRNHISKNGIPGKQGIYILDYNGAQVGMAAFYTVQNNKAYVLTAIIPTSMMQQKSDEVKQITQSFTIDGFSPVATTTKVLTPNSGNQNRSGVRSSSNTSAGRTHSGNSFTIMSHEAYDFKNREVKSLAASTGGGFAVYSTGSRNPEIGGKFIITNYNNLASVTSWDRNTLSNTDRSGRKNVPLNRVCIFQLRDGSFAKFMFTNIERRINNVIKLTCIVEYPASTSASTGNQNNQSSGLNSLSGHYKLISRSDGQDIWYERDIVFNGDGSHTFTMKGRNDPPQTNKGTWKLNGDNLTIKRNGQYPHTKTYKVQGNFLYQTVDGMIFTFKKQ